MVSAVGIVGGGWVIWLCARGFGKEGEKFEVCMDLVKITLRYILLIWLCWFVGWVVNCYDKLRIGGFRARFLNICFMVFWVYLIR
ncbi:lipid II flippase MurJ, partial [Neisseria sicca]|uniref:lipid II flippase MurJ n=1 Tax=Neisseria sicca TaxID=490 RepID=UPI0034D97AB4